MVCGLVKAGVVEARAYRQNETFEAAVQFARTEGIIPAPEPAHAIRAAIEEAQAAKEAGEERTILFGLCGHGHFDLAAYDAYLAGTLEDPEFSEEDLQSALDALPEARRSGVWPTRGAASRRSARPASVARQRGGRAGLRRPSAGRRRRSARARTAAGDLDAVGEIAHQRQPEARRRGCRGAGCMPEAVVVDRDLDALVIQARARRVPARRSRSRYAWTTAFVTASTPRLRWRPGRRRSR